MKQVYNNIDIEIEEQIEWLPYSKGRLIERWAYGNIIHPFALLLLYKPYAWMDKQRSHVLSEEAYTHLLKLDSETANGYQVANTPSLKVKLWTERVRHWMKHVFYFLWERITKHSIIIKKACSVYFFTIKTDEKTIFYTGLHSN